MLWTSINFVCDLVRELIEMLFTPFQQNEGLCFLNGTLQAASLTQCFDGSGALREKCVCHQDYNEQELIIVHQLVRLDVS